MTHPYGPEAEAEHALENARSAVIIADEKCGEAEYGSEVMSALERARREVEYALRVIRGQV